MYLNNGNKLNIQVFVNTGLKKLFWKRLPDIISNIDLGGGPNNNQWKLPSADGTDRAYSKKNKHKHHKESLTTKHGKRILDVESLLRTWRKLSRGKNITHKDREFISNCYRPILLLGIHMCKKSKLVNLNFFSAF